MLKPIDGEGPVPCEFLVCGEGPGWEEDRAGQVFQGKTGREVNRYFNGMDLPHRADVFITNIYRYYFGKDYIWSQDDLMRDEPRLLAELRRVQPRIIITLGRHATRYFLGDVDMDSTQGIPWYLPISDKFSFLSPTTVVFPVVHPAAGMHNPEMSPYVVSGFHELSRYLDGEVEPRELFDDPYPETTYEEIENTRQLDASLEGLTPDTSLSIDTEGWVSKPWSVQYSYVEGTGCLIRGTREDLLRRLDSTLSRVRPRLTYHSALHDLGMSRAFRLASLRQLDFDDTMVMAYLLQIMPQGLKALCLRECGMRMDDYADIVAEPAQRLAIEHMTWLFDLETIDHAQRCQDEFTRLTTTPYLDKKGKLKPGRKLRVPPKLPKSALHKAVERCLRAKDARKLWHDQVEDIQVAGYRRLGPMPDASLDYVPRAVAVSYGSRDADGTTRIKPVLQSRLKAMGLDTAYKLELGTYPLIERMSHVGIKPDLEHFAALSKRLGDECGRLRIRLEQATGRDTFNANSGDQVAEYLFNELGLEEGKKTSQGRASTNDKILEGLEHAYPEYPVITDIRSYREVFKLKNTFVDRLPDFVHRYPYDGRVHATFRTTRVVTGRLAASDPNLLAMPKHGKFAKDFRRGWVPEPGHVFGSWDLSQIELRVAAHLSQDPVMLAIYRGEKRNPDGSLIDLHAALAERIFGVKPKDQDESLHRLPSKAINFGFWMGQTAKGLLVECAKNGLQISEGDAQLWLDDAHRLYKGARPYMDACIAEAQQNGFVRWGSGRIRYIGGIRSSDERTREEAERFAYSTKIQGGAAEIMKTNEAVLWNDIIVPLQRQGRWIEPLVQIHDDLVLEIENEHLARDVHPRMVRCMTESYKGLSVPIKTSGEWGLNWCKKPKKGGLEGDMIAFEETA